MFEDLEVQLDSVLANLRAAFSDAETRLTAMEAQINTLDAPFLNAFDRLTALVQTTQGQFTQKLGTIRGAIQQLVP